MDDPLYAVFGASGCGRSIMPTARQQLAAEGVKPSRLIFVDDQPGPAEVNGHRLMTYAQFLAEPARSRYAVLAVANGEIRRKLADRCESDGVQPWGVKASTAVVMDDVECGPGAMISPFVTLGSNIRIGKHFHANLYSYVEHDCHIGDFVTFAPGVQCNGNIVIEDYAYVGTGAKIRQGKPGMPLVIGKHAVIGMGAVVLENIPAGTTVVGNPATVLIRS